MEIIEPVSQRILMGKILLVDDDKAICRTLSAIVEGMGHETENAYTLSEARDKIHSSPFDVVLLDVRREHRQW